MYFDYNGNMLKKMIFYDIVDTKACKALYYIFHNKHFGYCETYTLLDMLRKIDSSKGSCNVLYIMKGFI